MCNKGSGKLCNYAKFKGSWRTRAVTVGGSGTVIFHAWGVSDSHGISGSIVDERQDTEVQRNYNEFLLNKGQ